jgi:DNA-binding SARP family transcriptional activator
VPETCAVRLLGGFRVEVDGRPVAAEAWRHRRGADLVKLLALAPQHRLHRDQVMERLWPEMGAEPAAANLRKAVHFARRALGGKESIGTDAELISLWPAGGLDVDADHAGTESADLLPEDPYTDWIQPHRERLRSRRLEHLRASGRWEEVIEIDRSDEQACRALMRTDLDRGNRQAALRQFQRLREVLRMDLGIAPEAETVALFEEAVAMEGPPSTAAAEQAQAFLARGLVQWNELEHDAAQLSAEQARARALEHHLGRELGEASALLGMVAMARGRWPDVFRQEFATAIQLGAEAPFVLDAHLCLAEASLNASSQTTGALAHELLEQAVAAHSDTAEALMSLLIGEAEFFAGHLEESTEWLSRAASLYEKEMGSGLAFASIRLGEIAVARNRRAEAVANLSSARRLTQSSHLASHLRARVLEVMIKASASPDECRTILVEADSLVAHPKEVCRPCSIGLWVAAAIACARAGDVARSRYWLGHAERLAGMWSGGPWQAAVWEARAELRMAEGDRGQATALLREAGELFGQCGRPLDEARCLSALASAS